MKKICIILDLNGSILTRSRTCTFHGPRAFQAGPNSVLLRPGFSRFMNFLHQNFYIALWTSATQRSLDLIFDGASLVSPVFQKENFEFCFCRDKCLLKEWPKEEYLRRKEAAGGGYVKPIAIKDMEKVWKREEGIKFSAKNTLIVDDSVEKIPQPENHLWIPTFVPGQEDTELEQLEAYLQQMVEKQGEIEDIREYLRLSPFKEVKREAFDIEELKDAREMIAEKVGITEQNHVKIIIEEGQEILEPKGRD